MRPPLKLFRELTKKYGVTCAARKITIDSIGVGYYECGIAFAPETFIGDMLEVERELGERGFQSMLRVYKNRGILHFCTLRFSVKVTQPA